MTSYVGVFVNTLFLFRRVDAFNLSRTCCWRCLVGKTSKFALHSRSKPTFLFFLVTFVCYLRVSFFFFTLVLDYFYSSSCSLSSFFIVSTYLHFRFSCCLFLIVNFVSILVHEIIYCLSSFLIIISTCLHFQFFVPAYFYSLFPFLFLFLSIHPHYVVFHPCSCLFLPVTFVFILVSDYFCSLP